LITGCLYSNIIILYLEHAIETTIAWYVVFRDRKPKVYDSLGVYSEYVVDFSGAAFHSYSTRMQAEKDYVAFLDHQDELWKLEKVAQKAKDVTKKWCWKDWVILVRFIFIIILWYKIM
jgi:hypothetical protein